MSVRIGYGCLAEAHRLRPGKAALLGFGTGEEKKLSGEPILQGDAGVVDQTGVQRRHRLMRAETVRAVGRIT